jgi:hercynylcysteine S-oxide lyase
MSLRAWDIRARSANTWRPARTGSAARLGELGHATRTALADAAGWRVVEPVDEPTAITTLTPLDGSDPENVRSWLIAERDRHHLRRGAAPFELRAQVLRVSPHVDTTAEELETFGQALEQATDLSS